MKSRWLSAALRTVVLCAVLAGCGGGGSNHQSDLNLVIKVNSVQVAGPLHDGANQSITVASGDQVAFESAAGVSYSLQLTNVEAPDSSHDDRNYQMSPSSIVGGSARMAVTSSSNTSDLLTVTLLVQSQRFANRIWSVGDTLVQDEIYKTSTNRYTRHVIEASDTGSYIFETEDSPSWRITDYYDADSNHYKYVALDLSGSDTPGTRVCNQTPGRLIKSFPLFVGKQWGSEWDDECVLEDRYHYAAKNRVVGYEAVTVPAGTFQALHIVSDFDVTYPGGQVATSRSECWWSVDFQQDVRCDKSFVKDGMSDVYESVRAIQLAGQTTRVSSASPPMARRLHRNH